MRYSHNFSWLAITAFIIIIQVFKQPTTEKTKYLYDFRDGTIYKNHPLFSIDNTALQIILYYDDVEPANPLGSYRGCHKLGIVL